MTTIVASSTMARPRGWAVQLCRELLRGRPPPGGEASYLIATAMLNLDTPDEGGTTDFPYATPPLAVRAVAGELVIWWGCTPDGGLDSLSLHSGGEVARGTKFTATQFFYQPRRYCAAQEPAFVVAEREPPALPEFDDAF